MSSKYSSFLIYGTCLDNEQMLKRLKKLKKVCRDNEGQPIPLEDLETFELAELFDLPDGIELFYPWSDNIAYFGASWSTIKDNETGRQFKSRVFKGLKAAGLDVEKRELETLEEAWYDG